MKVLVDLNVWLDIALRPKDYPDSPKFYRQCLTSGRQLYVPASGYTTLYFIIKNYLNKAAALEFLGNLENDGVEILSFGKLEVSLAKQLQFNDFEDACIAATALKHSCEVIVTRNTKDFSKSPVKVISPRGMLVGRG